MHKPSVSQLVYSALYPKPRPNDPMNFGSHITRNLVPEVRAETSRFYGTLDCIEAQYPGLDYSFPPHRMRLGRFYHHSKLFRAFDDLGLTEDEIASLCRWEGTRSAKERYEREERVRVRDTTADGIFISSPTIPPSILVHRWSEEESLPTLQSAPLAHNVEPHGSDSVQSDTTAEESSEDELEESVGFALNQHLLEATAARERGADVPLDDVWEQWLKDAIERGSYEDILHTIREGSVDFSRAFTSPTSIYGNNSAGARQVGPRLMPAPNTALASGFDVSDPSVGPSPNPR
ncbi:uncharacterized protein CIMG_04938 [Coccidioides immitis RS]|uniref:Uncharacterized protein n=1 Tax=Coccidioides immitis (strain RS) TaxID=246410 RepID=J3KEJ2_COCIM|nr:uncharacterized protein CIMG_04938 [Coccidioides immitis RS]EAS33914.3 hypothetical protein CIMG_04938 [Coccidioides immitis RS]TPX21521.1 hypothetical protein DIZ76_015480 [Coccidioides immitis]